MTASTGTGFLRPKRALKRGTTTSKRHRFESFSQRISKLNIDPLRKRQYAQSSQGDGGSRFKVCLEKWKDLNLSENFTQFVRKAEPLCNSLPQILHHQLDLYNVLANHIREATTASLEPLLDLVSNLAYDLNFRFEEYYEQTIQLIATLVTKHTDVEALEWSFNCLAWLFKYLSRLLVPDLRPTMRAMTPLLGRSVKKPHVVRFAAEALSFLVRKAAAISSKDPQPLERLMSTVRDEAQLDSQEESVRDLYRKGLMSMFSTSMKGVDLRTHSTAVSIFQSMLTHAYGEAIESQGRVNMLQEICLGTMISILHHTDASGFRPILDAILETVILHMDSGDADSIKFASSLLFTAAAVRKGSRIEDWETFANAVIKLDTAGANCDGRRHTLRVLAVLLQGAPHGLLVSRHLSVFERLLEDTKPAHFLEFCNLFHKLGAERFNLFLKQFFMKFVSTEWQNNRLPLLLMLPRLLPDDELPAFVLPEAWQSDMVSYFASIQTVETHLLHCHIALKLGQRGHLSSETQQRLFEQTEIFLGSLWASDEMPTSVQDLLLGDALALYSKSSDTHSERLLELLPLLCNRFTTYCAFPPFLLALTAVVEKVGSSGAAGTQLDLLMEKLVTNLSSPLHAVREPCLRILQKVCSVRMPNLSAIIEMALSIETCEINLSSARFIPLRLRGMEDACRQASGSSILCRTVTTFCFGLLTYKLQAAKKAAMETITAISRFERGEEATTTICFEWLNSSKELQYEAEEVKDEAPPSPLDEFECSNLQLVSRKAEEAGTELEAAETILHRETRLSSGNRQERDPNADLLALQVFCAIPATAEKHSRRLVPYFLSVMNKEEHANNMTLDDAVSGPEQEIKGSQSSLYHRKLAILNLFSLFTNSRVLYRGAEVYSVLLTLLANGDVTIQRGALKSILTWKSKAVHERAENLLNLLDDARFRDELSSFLPTDGNGTLRQESHDPELMLVLLNLLYGRAISRKGTSTNKSSLSSRRRAILQVVAGLGEEHIQAFMRIAIFPFADATASTPDDFRNLVVLEARTKLRQQQGMLRMIAELLDFFGNALSKFTPGLALSILYCILNAQALLAHSEGRAAKDEAAPEEDARLRSVRQEGAMALTQLIRHGSARHLCPAVSILFEQVLNPRLQQLPTETAQSISWKLRILAALMASPGLVSTVVDSQGPSIPIISDVLCTPGVKDEVILFVCNDMIKVLVEQSSSVSDEMSSSTRSHVLEQGLLPNMAHILQNFVRLLARGPSKQVLMAAVEVVAMMAPFAKAGQSLHSVIEISSTLLDQPPGRVNPRTKSNLLFILQRLLPLAREQVDPAVLKTLCRSISGSFQYFTDAASRLLLSQVLRIASESEPGMSEVSELCEALNSISKKTLDTPDFERRSEAFSSINSTGYRRFTAAQWEPLIHNMLYHIRDEDELFMRTNAALSLNHAIEMNIVDESKSPDTSYLIKDMLFPALRKGMSEPSDVVRGEYLSVLACLVRSNPSWDMVRDMTGLLMDGDEEASFFNNVLHIQQHRRARALRRLRDNAQTWGLRSSNVAHFLNPLIESFILSEAESENAQNLRAEAVTTLGALIPLLEWPQVRAIMHRYAGYLQSRPGMEKWTTRVMKEIVENLVVARQRKLESELTTVDVLAKTLPRDEKRAAELSNTVLPLLIKYVHDKDDSTVSLRVPVALIVIKLLRLLPEATFRSRLPGILTDICQIFRSKALESRDAARTSLAEIATFIGPGYFGFIVKELRSALTRGPQLHVLSYTVHHLLVKTSDFFPGGSISDCYADIMSIVVDDIFGAVGQEKDAEDYTNKAKEVKQNKSFDTVDLLARKAEISQLASLMHPIQNVFEDKLDAKMIGRLDELMRRLGLALASNKHASDHRMLIFCYELVSASYDRQKARVTSSKHPSKAASNAGNRREKLQRFGLDLARSIVAKHAELATPSSIAGFVPMLGDLLVQGASETQASAARFLSAIMKVRLQSLDENAAFYVAECVKTIRNESSTTTELSQAALKLVTTVLRERQNLPVRVNDVAYLLKRITPDIEQPDRQGITFNFLKAVMARKMVLPELYELMDTVAHMMITNQTQSARDLARGAYFKFLMDFPQSKTRFSKQMVYLVRNLEYKHEEGRQSVLEAIHLLLTKVGDDLIADIYSGFLVPLIMVLANDESKRCRDMASVLLKLMIESAELPQLSDMLKLMRSWLAQEEQPVLRNVAMQVYAIALEVSSTTIDAEIPHLLAQTNAMLQTHLEQADAMEWENCFHALQVLTTIHTRSSQLLHNDSSSGVWSHLRRCLTFPHPWVSFSAAKLIGSLFGQMSEPGDEGTPVSEASSILPTNHDSRALIDSSLQILGATDTSEDLAAQNVRNLIFLSKFAVLNSTQDHNLLQNGTAPVNADTEFSGFESDLASSTSEATTTSHRHAALLHIILSTTRILRQPPSSSSPTALIPLTYSLLLLGTLISNVVPPSLLISFDIDVDYEYDYHYRPSKANRSLAYHILLPLAHLTDPAIPAPHSTDPSFRETYTRLQTNATELQSVMRSRLSLAATEESTGEADAGPSGSGSNIYASVMQGVHRDMKAKREQRRGKRRIDAVRNPEWAGAQKRKKREREKLGRKERSEAWGRRRKGL